MIVSVLQLIDDCRTAQKYPAWSNVERVHFAAGGKDLYPVEPAVAQLIPQTTTTFEAQL